MLVKIQKSTIFLGIVNTGKVYNSFEGIRLLRNSCLADEKNPLF